MHADDNHSARAKKFRHYPKTCTLSVQHKMLFIPRFKVGLLFDHFLKILFTFLPEKTRDGSNVAKKICELVGRSSTIKKP